MKRGRCANDIEKRFCVRVRSGDGDVGGDGSRTSDRDPLCTVNVRTMPLNAGVKVLGGIGADGKIDAVSGSPASNREDMMEIAPEP